MNTEKPCFNSPLFFVRLTFSLYFQVTVCNTAELSDKTAFYYFRLLCFLSFQKYPVVIIFAAKLLKFSRFYTYHLLF